MKFKPGDLVRFKPYSAFGAKHELRAKHLGVIVEVAPHEPPSLRRGYKVFWKDIMNIGPRTYFEEWLVAVDGKQDA